MSWNLPKLPGFTFQDPAKAQFHIGQKLTYKNGIPIAKCDARGIGGDPMDLKGAAHLNTNHENVFNPRLIYGGVNFNQFPSFQPRFVQYDKKFLIFKAYMKENSNDNDEYNMYQSMRNVTIIYHLEDDTLTVVEPHIMNSGLWQGKVVKRGKILKDGEGNHWHWKDLNVGIDLSIQGMVFHTTSCDDYTKQFLVSQGIELGEDENKCDKEEEREKRQQRIYTVTETKNESFRNLERYLKYENASLQFDAVWEDNSDIKNYKIQYYLYDDTIEIKESNNDYEGTDSCPKLLRRTKVLKNWKKQIALSPVLALDAELKEGDEEYFKATDFIVGNTVNILGRNFLIYDCDQDTRNYYKEHLNITQDDKIQVQNPQKRKRNKYPFQRNVDVCLAAPPDSCITFLDNPPHKDVVQYNLNSNKALRYFCEIISVHPEDMGRKFVLLYNLADGTVRIDELPVKNSGLIPGRFSGPYNVYLPEGKNVIRYTPDMFYIGAIVKINQHRFRICGADLFVYKYMKQFPEKFPREVVQNIRDYHLRCGNIDNDEKMFTSLKVQNDEDNVNGADELVVPMGNLDCEAQNTNWRADHLGFPLQGMESAQTLPEIDEKPLEERRENQQVVCLTGLTQDPLNDEHQFTNQVCNCSDGSCVHGQKCEERPKRVTFAENIEH